MKMGETMVLYKRMAPGLGVVESSISLIPHRFSLSGVASSAIQWHSWLVYSIIRIIRKSQRSTRTL